MIRWVRKYYNDIDSKHKETWEKEIKEHYYAIGKATIDEFLERYNPKRD